MEPKLPKMNLLLLFLLVRNASLESPLKNPRPGDPERSSKFEYFVVAITEHHPPGEWGLVPLRDRIMQSFMHRVHTAMYSIYHLGVRPP